MSGDIPGIAPHIHVLFHEGGAVLLDVIGNDLSVMDAKGADRLRVVNEGGKVDSPQWLSVLVTRGVVDFAGQPRPRLFPEVTPLTQEELLTAGSFAVALEAADPPELTLLEYSIAQEGLYSALRLLESPFLGAIKELRTKRAATSEPASLEVATRMKAAVQWVGADYPDTLACLEISVATSLACAAIGLGVEVVLGAAVDPISPHAWPETQGHAVHLPGDEQIAGMRYPIFKV